MIAKDEMFSFSSPQSTQVGSLVDDDGDTDVDDTEASTPDASQDSISWPIPVTKGFRGATKVLQSSEGDVMDAAWALCGLSRS